MSKKEDEIPTPEDKIQNTKQYRTWTVDPHNPTIPELIIEKFGRYVPSVGNSDETLIRADGNFIVIPLPHANNMWSLSVFEYIRKVVTEYPSAYCDHSHPIKYQTINDGYKNCIFIDCSNVEKLIP